LSSHRFYLRVNARNVRARRADETEGFVHGGTIRPARFQVGRYVAVNSMSILHPQWHNSPEGQ
jgi:RimJ/RimL family protein N-acetyltransferase